MVKPAGKTQLCNCLTRDTRFVRFTSTNRHVQACLLEGLNFQRSIVLRGLISADSPDTAPKQGNPGERNYVSISASKMSSLRKYAPVISFTRPLLHPPQSSTQTQTEKGAHTSPPVLHAKVSRASFSRRLVYPARNPRRTRAQALVLFKRAGPCRSFLPDGPTVYVSRLFALSLGSNHASIRRRSTDK